MKEFNYKKYINENQIEQKHQPTPDNLDLERVALVLLKNKEDYKHQYGVDTFDSILKVYIGKLKNLGIDFTGETEETIINCFAHYTLFGAQILNPKNA
jgi:hypothetical protein